MFYYGNDVIPILLSPYYHFVARMETVLLTYPFLPFFPGIIDILPNFKLRHTC